MWLLPAFPLVSRITARVYYRLTITGERVPRAGPVLLVANHPNSLLDPVLVAASARRRLRFLAKAPLFTDPKVGWLVRGSGAIPVYRRVDDPSAMDRNANMFRAVHAALAAGDAVGIFPEGLTHSDPSLAPLKTGAARMALGAAVSLGSPFPIVPVGLVFRHKDVFRSSALAIVGSEVSWSDLAGRAAEDADAVHELTGRIATALRGVTVNLEQWADQPLAECAVRIWESEFGADANWTGRVARLDVTRKLLAHVRANPSAQWDALTHDVAAHARQLKRLRLRPADLRADVTVRRGARWGVVRLPLIAVPATVTAVTGFLLFWIPFQVTGRLVARMRPDDDRRSTYKLLVGIATYAAWVFALAAVTAIAVGPLTGLALLLLMPVIGMVGLTIRERWRGTWRDARRFFLLRSRGPLVTELRDRQTRLARRLKELYDDTLGKGSSA